MLICYCQPLLDRVELVCPNTGGMPKVTALILAFKETESLSASLETYDQAGFLQVRGARLREFESEIVCERDRRSKSRGERKTQTVR